MKIVKILTPLTLIVMFAYALFKISVLDFPGFAYLQYLYPEPTATLLKDESSSLSIIIYTLLLALPVLTFGAWWQERKQRQGDYRMTEGLGVITITEQAMKKIIRAVCSNIPGITDMQVELQRQGAGIDIKLLVKIDRPESWMTAKSELLRIIPEELNRYVGGDVINTLEIVCLDLAFTPGGPGSYSPTYLPEPAVSATESKSRSAGDEASTLRIREPKKPVEAEEGPESPENDEAAEDENNDEGDEKKTESSF